MNDFVKVIGIIIACAVGAFFLAQSYGQGNSFSAADIFASSDKSYIPRIGNYIPPSWRGESVSNEIILADNTVTKDTERISLAELQEENKKALAQKEQERNVLTASAANAGSLSVVNSSGVGLMWVVIGMMVVILVMLSRLIHKKKRLAYSRPLNQFSSFS